MQNSAYEPVDPITARNQHAALYRGSVAPDPDVELAAKRKMVTARIDKAIRDAFRDYPLELHPAQIDYLTSLIANGGDK